MKEKFTDRLKRIGVFGWIVFGAFCVTSLFIALAGLLACAIGDSIGWVFLIIGTLTLCFFVFIFIILPYIQWKKGIEPQKPAPKPIVKKPISKKEIYDEYLDHQKLVRAFSLPVCCVIGLVSLCIPFFVPMEENATTGAYIFCYVFLPICSVIMIGGGIFVFCNACKKIKNFDKTTLNLYERALLKKPETVWSADSSDDYVYEFAEFGEYKESSQSLGFGDAKAGDNYLLVCAEKSNKILQIYSLKHYELSEDILAEIK